MTTHPALPGPPPRTGPRGFGDQVIGLAAVVDRVVSAWSTCLVIADPRDVPFLMAQVGAPHQVVYAADGYDVWTCLSSNDNPEPVAFGVSVEVAAQYIIDDFWMAR